MYQPPADHRVIGPTADDWAIYAKRKPRRVAKPARAANDNRLTADRMPALVRYRDEPDHPYEPLQSTWSVVPNGAVEVYEQDEGDEGEPEKLYHQELYLELKPSIEGILRSMREDWTWYKPSPEDYDGESVATIGTLRFSNGKTRERMFKTTADGKVGLFLSRMPTGAMLGASEELGAPRGPAGESSERMVISNRHLTQMVMRRDSSGNLISPPLEPRAFISKGETRSGPDLTPAQSRALIAQAIANTPNMPPVTICPPGIASGTARYSDQFVGMKPKPKSTAKSGAIGWVDFFTAGRERAEWLATMDQMDEGDRQVLDAAMSAETYADVGIAAGQSPEYARRKGGKLALVAANDNLAAHLAA